MAADDTLALVVCPALISARRDRFTDVVVKIIAFLIYLPSVASLCFPAAIKKACSCFHKGSYEREVPYAASRMPQASLL